MDEQLATAMAALPLVAILRGLRPEEALGIGEALLEAGFRILEVPLNSPEPFESIRLLAVRSGPGGGRRRHGDDAEQVARLREAGGRLVVMPHTDPEVIKAAKAAGMACLPGVATPSEAFAALRAGADGLKLFPAETLGPTALKAWRAILPPGNRGLAGGWHHAREHAALAGGRGRRISGSARHCTGREQPPAKSAKRQRGSLPRGGRVRRRRRWPRLRPRLGLGQRLGLGADLRGRGRGRPGFLGLAQLGSLACVDLGVDRRQQGRRGGLLRLGARPAEALGIGPEHGQSLVVHGWKLGNHRTRP